MCVVLFSDGEDKRAYKHLEAVVKLVVSKQSLEIFTKFDDFSARIRRFPRDIDVAVLSLQNDYQLTALLSLAHYIDSVRKILILPDRNYHMVSMGHRLYPRFVTFTNGNFSDLSAVLSKMLRKTSSSRILGRKNQR